MEKSITWSIILILLNILVYVLRSKDTVRITIPLSSAYITLYIYFIPHM